MRSIPLAPAALAAIIAIAAGSSARADTPPPAAVRLSDEVTFTHWAGAIKRARAYARPSKDARPVGHLRFLTEDGFPEVYVLLSSRPDSEGVTWVRVRLPRRPADATGWVRRSALGQFHLVHTRLVVDHRALRVTLYRRGKPRFRARVGMGAPSTPTPSGSFWIREKFPTGDPGGFYGPWAWGTSAYSNLSDWPGGGVVGIHGTSEPGLIPGRPSHGCIRVPNGAVRRLARLMGVGTPVRVL